MTVRQQSGSSSGWTEVWALGAASLIKGAGGLAGGSQALLADALNSASDAVRGSRSAGMQALTAKMLLAALVLVGAIEASISGVGRLLDDPGKAPGLGAVIAFFAAVFLSETLFVLRYRRLERENREAALKYAAEHRLALYASMFVAAGMALSIAGSGFGITEFVYADAAASLLVAAVAIVNALRIMLSVFKESPAAHKRSEEDPTPFLETVQRVRGVIEVRELRAFRTSEVLKIELVLSVNPRMTVKEAEEVAQRSRDLLLHRFVQVIEVDVRVEPYHTGYPYKSNDELLGSGDQPTIVQ
ncbi:cation diffusion facilitator family transporter [Saccharibacillus alkalitolerans]|uniref:Cation transporter n=1 Tax=Saccharibacillus alkalitolerans TaxID=2705290 RepID=A0ABX0F0V7_9BACL|nr:cation transporter [Saccharibacillus alkalitolerans]NGZ73689.1 cation transporter [Saccharibacillus alkalitolerans]